MVRELALLLLIATAMPVRADLLCFGARWCQPCQEMKPVLGRLEQEGYPLHHIDVDARPELAQKYGVTAVPSYIFVDRSGQVLGRIDRATTYASLRSLMAQVPAANPSAATPAPRPLVPTAGAGVPPANVGGGPNVRSNPATAEQRALAATIRLRVEDPQGHSFGTGTVIDIHGQEALAVTCGHIFRDSQGQGTILIDRFDGSTPQPIRGTVISYDLDLDVALVSFHTPHPITPVPLANPNTAPQPGTPIFSVGCDHGKPPTVKRGKINRVNKYLGPANLTASGRPVDGRSGGGLFSADGTLLGVCNAADPELDEGLYAALPRLVGELDRHGLSFIHQRSGSPQPVGAPQPGGEPSPRMLANQQPPAAAVPPRQDTQVRPAAFQSTPSEPGRLAPGAVNAAPREPELVCTIQSGPRAGQTYVIRNPSRVLMEYLEREQARLR